MADLLAIADHEEMIWANLFWEEYIKMPNAKMFQVVACNKKFATKVRTITANLARAIHSKKAFLKGCLALTSRCKTIVCTPLIT